VESEVLIHGCVTLQTCSELGVGCYVIEKEELSLINRLSNGMRQAQFSGRSKIAPEIVCSIRGFGSQIIRTKTDCAVGY
jgi:hypothetical protein